MEYFKARLSSDMIEKLTPTQIDDLVSEAQKGNTESFGKLYDIYADSIYKYIYYRVDKEDALDLTENVFLKVWENIKSYKTGKKYFTSWLYRIAHNTVVDSYRRGKKTEELAEWLPDEKLDNNPIVLTERNLTNQALTLAISKLKKRYQQVIILKYINELDNSEIAKVLKRSEGSLRILKFRALKALRQILEEMNVKY